MSNADTFPLHSPDPADRQTAELLMARLLEVTERLAGSGTEGEVFQVVLRPAMEALGARSGTVLLVRGAGLRVVARRGQEGTGVWQDGPLTDDTPAADVLRVGQPLFFEHGGHLTAAYPELEARTGGRAAMASALLPMFLDGGPLGVLVLDFPEPHSFTPEEERFLRTLAAQGALALGRSRAARELRESHDRLVLTLQAGGFGLWEWDLGSGLLHRAPETMRLLGTEHAVAPFGDYLARVHPEDRTGVVETFERARQGGPASFVVAHRLTRGDGQQVWVEQHTRVERDADGRATRFLGVTADITARKEAEEERARLARLVEESTDFIGIADLDGRAVYVNAAGRRLVGVEGPEEAGRLNVLDVFPPEDRPFVREVILPQTLEKGRWEGDFRFRHLGTGEAIDVAYNMFALTDPGSGRPVAFATVTRDVRGRKRQEREVQALNADLERRVAERTQVAEVLAGLGDALQRATTPGDVAGLALDRLGPALRARCMLVIRLDGETIRLPTVWGDPPESVVSYMRRPNLGLADLPFLRRIARERRGMYVGDYRAQTGALAGFPSLAAGAEPVCTPDGTLEGFLVVWRPGTPDGWQDVERNLLRRAAGTLGLALERAAAAARLEAHARRTEEEARAQEAFVAFTEAVGTQTDVAALVRRAIDVLMAHFPQGSVGYYERDGDLWKGKVGSGNSPEPMQRSVEAGLPGDTPAIARMLREGEAVFVDGWDAAQGVASSEVYGAVACYPLAVHGEPDSFLGVALRDTRRWRERDRALVRAVGRGLTLALERARQAREITVWRQRYEVAVQGSGHLLYDWDPATDLIVYGGAAEHITGYTPEELEGKLADWTQRLIHPEDRAAFRREIARVVGSEDEFHLPFRIVRKDGQVREVEDDGYFMRDARGRLTRMVGFVKDVTERNRAEADRARLARLVEESGDYIGIADHAGRVTYLNAAGRALVGLAPDALPGIILDTVHADDRERFETAILPLVDRVGRWQGDVTMRHLETGEPIATNRTIFTLSDPATGEPGGYATITRDVRRRKAAEEALRRANLELQRSNAELEQFAYVASHDLQEPLRTVTSFAQLLSARYGGQLDPKADLYLRLITEGTGRMSRLLNDLLAFARVSSAARPPVSVDTASLVAQVAQDLHAQIERSGARVEVGELPGVLGDASQMRQLFQNLLGNALKFRHPARTPEVRVEARVEGSFARFSVSDNGIGIAPEFFDRIFTIFQRLHTRETYEGSGIGLSIARKIVERHGGRLWLESNEGEGTTFLFTLPLAPVVAAPGGEG